MACGDFIHPLKRGGTNQAQRLLPGLQPDYVRVDEKGPADWMAYTDALSAFIKYYDLDNNFNAADPERNSWKPYFSKDISAVLAFVAVQDPGALQGVADRFAILRDDANQGNLPLLQQKFAELFGAELTFSRALDNLIARLPDEAPLKLVATNLIESKLAPALNRLLRYYKAAQGAGLLLEAEVPDWKILGLPVAKASAIITAGLGNLWITNAAAGWFFYFANNTPAGVPPDPSIFGDALATPAQKIRHAANHNLFSSLFDQYLMAYARVLKEAQSNLEVTLGDWRKHPPHYALFLSFLKLLQPVQSDLNQFTSRHLDFYYRDVLQLQPRTPEPDSAYVTIELAKAVPEFMLPKNTLFRAGKDAGGQDVVYALGKDVVFNKAKVARLMAVYQGQTRDDLTGVVNDQRLFAAPAINSADGLGAKLTSPQGEWQPFVNRTYADGKVQSIDEPAAQIGFAVASHFLALAEGNRQVAIRLNTSSDAALAGLHCDVCLTTAKGWYQASGITITTGMLKDGTTPCAAIAFTLDTLAPAINDYDPAVHGGTLGVAVPVAKILLQNLPGQAYEYESVRNVTVAKVEVQVDVGTPATASYTAEAAKQLQLANSSGPVDPAKPFLPFGPQPVGGDTFLIGSREILSKQGAQVRFNAEWIKLPASANDITYGGTGGDTPSTTLQYLSGGVWKNLSTSVPVFSGVTSLVSFPSSLQAIPSDGVLPYEDSLGPFTNQSTSGFLRLKLNSGFGHKDYQAALTAYLIDQSKTSPTLSLPVEPYTPTLQSFLASYTATADADLTTADAAAFNDRVVRFFHLYPFGDAEQHTQISGATTVYLMPQFSYTETPLDAGASPGGSGFTLPNQGEFYVGFEDLVAEQSVSILFQVLEGTTDPQLLKPAEHVYFSYLANNTWKAIRRNLVGDGTRQLIQSGLVELAIPADATTTNTVLPAGYLWLRFSVAEAADAVCKVLAVLPQAAEVTYQAGPLNAPDFPASPLAAGTIAKLKEPLSAIKKIQQPYPSFRTGRGGETDEWFRVRASERLRHKDRAMAIWDYEHLVLEAFPQIHKVKCLSHTKLVPDPDHPGQTLYSELAPGCVLVITIPDLADRNDANPLRPYTSADLLAEVQDYLQSRTTCHAQVIAANPLFEELRLEFTVTLMKGYDDAAFYRTQLQEEITEYLTPWAFGSTADIQFGGKVYKSALINFVEDRPYVDFLVDAKLYHKAGDGAIESGDLEEVTASTARSILVSAPASKHNITVQLHVDAPLLEEECTPDE